MIDIYVTYYARTAGGKDLNDVTADVVEEIKHVTDTPHRLIVVGWTEDDATWADLEHKLSHLIDVRVVRNNRPNRPDTQPSQRNKVLDLARVAGDHPFVLLHNDTRPARGWLKNLTRDLWSCEHRWGYGSSIITPMHVPFVRLHSSRPGWAALQASRLVTIEQMIPWMAKYGQFNKTEESIIPNGLMTKLFAAHGQLDTVSGRLLCPIWVEPSDDGHQLMMFIARPSFFDVVGPCDEAFAGANYDDVDWGMRALIAGKHSLRSRTALVGHIEGLTFINAGPLIPMRNDQVFRDKWGDVVFDEMISGAIWAQLRNGTGSPVKDKR